MQKYTVYTDGGARGNPGPAAIGIIIKSHEKTETYKEKIGITTNNIAEYTAILKAIEILEKKSKTCEIKVEFFLDSELVVKQLKGIYKIKNNELKKIHDEIKKFTKIIKNAEFTNIPREQNKEADALVNEALDEEDEEKNK